MQYDVIIDGVKGINHDLYIINRVDIPITKRNVSYIDIPGRDGYLTKENGLSDKSFSINFNFVERSNMPKKIRGITPWLLNAEKIMFTDDLEVYYKVKAIEFGDIARELAVFGSFTAYVTIEPFAYMHENIININSASTLLNLGTYESNPYLKVYYSGEVKLKINDKSIKLKEVDNYIEIDSEIEECFKGDDPLNNKMEGKFPIFNLGVNKISWEGNVSKIEINPRWRYV